jgi:CheY-like chemotaxis protein/HPt (histidine-containing phosphotransfer) domain-containing protein
MSMTPRILLVDDDPLGQDLARGILNSAGFEADIAPDGFAALRLLREHPYGMALVDYRLPEMDGYTLAKLLRDAAETSGSPLKLVGLTADRDGLVARRGTDVLFETILAKPFEPQKLVDLVCRILPANQRIIDVRNAANALLAEPGFDRARAAARAFWRARGLTDVPKIFAIPEPTADQAFNLGICFDLIEQDAAELLVLLNVCGLEALSRIRGQSGNRLPPILTLDKSLTPISDVYFHVGDPDSWSEVAERLISFSRTMKVTEKPAIVCCISDHVVHHDLQVFRKMTALVGNERSSALLARFSQILEGSFEQGYELPDERQLLLDQLRATVSAAGMLGFTQLVETCRDLETALKEDRDLGKSLDKVRAAKLRSLRTLSQLQGSAG